MRLASLCAALLAACAIGKTERVTGTVSIRERGPLPAGARLRVRILDVSPATAGSPVAGEQVIAELGEGPIEFAIPYAPFDIDAERAYIVEARILVGDTVLYRSGPGNHVLTNGNPRRVAVEVRPVR